MGVEKPMNILRIIVILMTTLGTSLVSAQNEQKTVPIVSGANYTTSDSVQNPDVRLKSINGTGCNATVTIGGVSIAYYAPPLQAWGSWKAIEVGFIGVHNFSVDVRPVGDCTLVGELRYY